MSGILQREDGWCESSMNRCGSSLRAVNRKDGQMGPAQTMECHILVGFNGVPPLSQEAVSEQSRTGRVQRNLKLGGNTDVKVRPKLVVVYQLRAFCVGEKLRNSKTASARTAHGSI